MDSTTGKITVDQDDRFYTDMYVISSLPLARQIGYTDPTDWTIYAQNKMIESDSVDGISESDIDTENKITYWTTEYTTSIQKEEKVWSFNDFAEMKTAADEGKINPSKYEISSFWKVNEESGHLTWVGR